MFLFWKKVQTQFLFLRAMVAESFKNSENFSFSSHRCKMQGKEVVLHKINFFQLKGTINLIQKWFYDSIFSEWNVRFIPVPFTALCIAKNEIIIQIFKCTFISVTFRNKISIFLIKSPWHPWSFLDLKGTIVNRTLYILRVNQNYANSPFKEPFIH